MRRIFVELPAFTRLVSSKALSDEQLARVQEDIASIGGATIAGTGGIRRIRCEDSNKGKRGGWRVLFADYERVGVTVLIWAFPKNRQTDLTAAQRGVIRRRKAQLDEEIQVRYGHPEPE